jgi:hypothetical protein
MYYFLAMPFNLILSDILSKALVILCRGDLLMAIIAGFILTAPE